MRPGSLLLAGLGLWVAILIFTGGHALLTGAIRMGPSGSAPIRRAEDPARFWRAVGLSTGGLVVALLVTAAIVRMAVPAGWAEAAQVLGFSGSRD